MGCSLNERHGNVEAVINDENYKANVEYAIKDFIGSKEGMNAHDSNYHKKIEKLLTKFFMDNQFSFGVITNPETFIDGLREYIYFGYGSVNVLFSNKQNTSLRSMTGIYNKTKRLINKLEKNKYKSPSKFIQLVKDPFVFAIENDKSGMFVKFINAAKSFTDRKEQVFGNHILKIKKTAIKRTKRFEHRIFKGLSNSEINSHIADGVSGFATNEMKATDEIKATNEAKNYRQREVLITGVKDWETGSPKFKVVYKDNGETATLSPTMRPNKESGIIFKSDVEREFIDALKDKYASELPTKVMNGQIRYIEIGGMPTKYDSSVIKRILKEEYIRHKSGDSKMSGKLHSVVDSDNIKYTYVMVKQPEENEGKEIYKAYLYSATDLDSDEKRFYYERMTKGDDEFDFEYIASSNFKETLNWKKIMLDEGVFGDGYYEATKHDRYGTILNKYYRFIEGSSNRQFTKFKRINHEKIIEELDNDLFWDNINQNRKMLRVASSYINEASKTTTEGENPSITERIIKATEYLNQYAKDPKIKELIEYFNLDELYNYTFYDIKENYFPNMYHKEQTDKATVKEIERLQERLEESTDSNEIEYLKKQIRMLDTIPSRGTYEDSMVLSQKIAYTKHRTVKMSGMDIRKDSNVIRDYLKFISYIVEKNKVSATALETIVSMIKANNNKVDGLETKIKYITTKSKQAFGDATAEIPNLFHIMSNQKFADILNKVLRKTDPDYKYTAEDAEKLIRTMKSLVAIVTLGVNPSEQNRWQVMSAIIQLGYDKWREAVQKLSKFEDEEDSLNLQEVFRRSGIDNMFTLLSDVVFIGENSDDTDFGWVEFGSFKVPTLNMVDYVRLFRAGREKFIKGETVFDKHFEGLALKRAKKLYKTFNRLEQKTKNEKIRHEIRYLKGVYFDLMYANKKESSPGRIRHLFKELLTITAEDKLRQMVSWKLGWYWDKESKALKTLTGTEQKIRREIAMMALLAADEKGLLPGGNRSIGDESRRYMTPEAINVMRTTSYLFAFGMNKVFTPLMFEGTGGMFHQFKIYPLYQLLLDSRNFQNLIDTTEGETIFKKISDISKRVAKGTINFKQLMNPNFKDNTIDHDVLTFIRGMYIRGGVTALTSLNELARVFTIPYGVASLISGGKFQLIGKRFKGMENPVMGFFGRMLGRALILSIYGWAMGDDDKDKWLRDISFFVLAPFLSVYINILLDWGSFTGRVKDAVDFALDN